MCNIVVEDCTQNIFLIYFQWFCPLPNPKLSESLKKSPLPIVAAGLLSPDLVGIALFNFFWCHLAKMYSVTATPTATSSSGCCRNGATSSKESAAMCVAFVPGWSLVFTFNEVKSIQAVPFKGWGGSLNRIKPVLWGSFFRGRQSGLVNDKRNKRECLWKLPKTKKIFSRPISHCKTEREQVPFLMHHRTINYACIKETIG